jgi:TrmH family RNA methyltransferase
VEPPRVPTELSARNPRIALVHELLSPAGRREQRRFTAEGPTLLDEAARSGLSPLEVYATPKGLRDGGALPARYEAAGIAVYEIPDHAFARISDVTTSSGILGVFELPQHALVGLLARPGTVLLLAGVNDPGNAGTLVRSAEAFGAAGVLFGRGGADPFGPKVVRAAMGSIFRLPVAQVTADELLAAAAAAGRPVVATDTDGEDLGVAGIPPNAVLAVGNERRGVRDWLPRWDRAVRIPQRSSTESLNAAVAGSIVLYEALRCQDPCQVAENP